MENLHGHAAGNGGDGQGDTYCSSRSSPTRTAKELPTDYRASSRPYHDYAVSDAACTDGSKARRVSIVSALSVPRSRRNRRHSVVRLIPSSAAVSV